MFINDLGIDPVSESSLLKYADDFTLIIPVWKENHNSTSADVVNSYMKWIDDNCMKCNLSKCKELIIRKNGFHTALERVQDIPQFSELTILGVTFQENCRFSVHVKNTLIAANKCLYVLRTLRKEGYSQLEIDKLFSALVMTKLSYGVSVYGASPPEITSMQCFSGSLP